MPAWLVFTLMVLATYRLTRLVTVDEFPPVAGPRERFIEAHDNAWGYLLSCAFCMSVWCSALVTFLVWLTLNVWGDGLPLPFLVWGGVAGVVSLLYELLPE